MSVFNCENTIERSLKSVINQTLQDWQLIICDDFSNDKTYNILKEYKKKLKQKMQLIRNDSNKGLAYSLNRCLHLSKGKYIARQDGDDYSENNRLQIQYDFLENNLKYAFVSNSFFYTYDNKIFGKNILKENPNIHDFIKGTPFCHASTMIRKNILNKIGNYSTQNKYYRVEDYELWFRFYKNGFIGHNLKKELYYVEENFKAYKRRTLNNRLNEFIFKIHIQKHVRFHFRNFYYILKPIFIIIIPYFIYNVLRKKKFRL
tara:strand:+ start:402 stop:1181 length:780 start_codon:yes stop_codon:yes gene_type:complete